MFLETTNLKNTSSVVEYSIILFFNINYDILNLLVSLNVHTQKMRRGFEMLIIKI